MKIVLGIIKSSKGAGSSKVVVVVVVVAQLNARG